MGPIHFATRHHAYINIHRSYHRLNIASLYIQTGNRIGPKTARLHNRLSRNHFDIKWKVYLRIFQFIILVQKWFQQLRIKQLPCNDMRCLDTFLNCFWVGLWCSHNSAGLMPCFWNNFSFRRHQFIHKFDLLHLFTDKKTCIINLWIFHLDRRISNLGRNIVHAIFEFGGKYRAHQHCLLFCSGGWICS